MRPIQFIFYRFAIFIFPFLLSACVSHSDTSDFDKQAAAKADPETASAKQQPGEQVVQFVKKETAPKASE